ncbi:alpha/beta fold hydrolase [Nocardia xishanensis]|uniref:alpha/beta fold hydrolase n=1 Tax=Nocardia xishanensis TaxID=238964 RepID=UPI0008331945|nr:alpha/beta hydrolase [Nocardia xishanensis]
MVTSNQNDLLQRLGSDGRLHMLLAGFDGIADFRLGGDPLRLRIRDGAIEADSSVADPDVLVEFPPELWAAATQLEAPPGTESLSSALSHGATLTGDWRAVIAPYLAAWSRIVRIASDAAAGRREVHVACDPFVDSDDAVGRYVRYSVGSENYRVYYEQSGHGEIPVLFMHTAGGDGRQYRNVLAHPRLQEKYTLVAIDLPYHGKSLPPVGTSWWERPLEITKDLLMDWITGFIKATGLDRPIFVGCSVGGQLASDLCAHHPESIRGAIGVNGLYDMRGLTELAAMNAMYHNPAISPNVVPAIMYDASGPGAPEEFRHELAWIYASNQRDTYPSDCDYYYFGHDLSENGHLIDTSRTPLTMLTGEYDLSAVIPEHGGEAIAQTIPGATHRVMKGLSHFAPSDDPVRFTAELERALDETVAQCTPTRVSA